MAKFSLSIILPIFILTITSLPPLTHASFARPITRAELGLKEDNNHLTHLTFYWHDILSGQTPTSVRIANATTTSRSPTLFGSLSMIDDPLTDGPKPTSKQVGRAQGMYASSDLKHVALTMIMNFAFIEGEYNGSTLSVMGRNPVFESVREMGVVGGTGAFRFAKGYCEARTQVFDQKSGDAVVKYDVYVSHSGSGSGSGSSSSAAPALGQVSISSMVSLLVIPLLYFI